MILRCRQDRGLHGVRDMQAGPSQAGQGPEIKHLHELGQTKRPTGQAGLGQAANKIVPKMCM